MKIKIPYKYTAATILLMSASAVLIVIALITNRGDITTNAFVISGMACAMIGILTLTFSGDEPLDQWFVGILPAQGSINLCSIIRHIGIYGAAHFLPPSVSGEKRVMQFNPISTYNGKIGSGLVTRTSCDLLIQNLKMRKALVIPDKNEELTLLICETIEDFFKFAHKISVSWEDSRVIITFHRYLFYDGCKVIAQEPSQCCVMSPCPACSLCGAMIAEGKERVVRIDRCSISSSSRDVTTVFTILPLPDSNQ